MPGDVDLDRAKATEARARYRTEGLVSIPSDPRIEQALGVGERLVARRSDVCLDRRDAERGREPFGDLFVTSERILLIGPTTVSIPLEEIGEAALLGDRLVLLLRGGTAVAIRADRPRLLRVQISAARVALERAAAARTAGQLSPR